MKETDQLPVKQFICIHKTVSESLSRLNLGNNISAKAAINDLL